MRLIIFIFLFLVVKLNFSQNWIYVGSSVDGDKYYLRDNSTTSDFGYKKVWSKQEAKTLTYKKGSKTYTLLNGYCLELLEYDCFERKSRLISYSYYNSKGNIVYSYQSELFEVEWIDVVPDSIGELLLQTVCDLF